MKQVTFRGTGQLNGVVIIDKTIELDDKIAQSLRGSKRDEVKSAILAVHYPGVKIKPNQIGCEIKEIRESNQNYNARIENIRLKNLVEILKKENSKISKAKNLLSKYKDAMKEKDNEIEELRRNNQDLYNCIQGLPKIIKKLFIKNTDIKLLK